MTHTLINKLITNPKINILDDHNAVIKTEHLTLSIYDKDNLVGFKLEGLVWGHRVYIVHDTDNYSRTNSTYKYMYDEAEADTIHVVKMFLENRIKVESLTYKKFFHQVNDIQIVIPNSNGVKVSYPRISVNTVNFKTA